jgi:N-acetylmuramoyl-L-alanine amidase
MRTSSTLRRLALAAAVSGAAITATPALANAASTCTFTPDSLPARVEVFDGSGTARLGIERSGSTIMIADVGGPLKPCPGPTGNATVFNTDQIVVHGNASATFDEFSTQTLAPGKTPEPDGNSEIETIINNAAPTNLAVFGTVAPDTMRVASGGGVMLGSDLDVDVRARSATEITLQGGLGSDYLSGRGGYPSSIPGPATTKVTMFGEEGDNILIDGPLPGDQLQGGDGNDTLFTHDFRSSDLSFGLGGFDQLTKDPGDTAGSDVDRINVVGVGRLKLAPAAVTARAGKPARVKLAWKHPKAWKQLRSLKLRASDAGEVVATITIDPGRGRISDRGAITATSRSKVAHRGKTVTADLDLRPAHKLAGRTLHLAVQATDAQGRTQVEPLAGRLAIAR